MDTTTGDFPPTSPPLPDDYSDVDSVSSDDDPATERRKYQRGGRKQSTTKVARESRMPSVPESEIATEPNHREEVNMDSGIMQMNGETRMNGRINVNEEPQKEKTTCPECAARKQKAELAQQPEPKQPSPFETGIRAFNLKRAASSGGRPVGVRATSENKKSKRKTQKKKKKKAKAEVKESETEEESSSEEEEKEPETKPGMSIRLDLNLVVEIFLKAKIQGDVTITFL
jgi:hypothetical protein